MKRIVFHLAAWGIVAVAAGIGWQTASTIAAESQCQPSCGNKLACRMANYREYQDDAWQQLPAIGVKYVFMNVPAPDQVDSVMKKLADSGLKAAVLRGDTDLSRESSVDELDKQMAICEKMGVKYMFLSPKHPGVSKEVAFERLRKIGDVAKKHGVTVGLETHPDLGTNGDEHVATMKAINHPNIRVNFDCANITYYNTGTDAVAELKKCIDYVATVEIKDHNGQFKTWNFPALGKGIVDIPGVLKVLKEHKYQGPITIEIEGVEGINRDRSQIKKDIADSMAYVRSLGKFD
ncbi:MAG: sugar phosphate isomerase/epimerase [Pirellulales bacterium]|nr:sugar phosphate isomerase/epimerase [Pirellulales bacterium]